MAVCYIYLPTSRPFLKWGCQTFQWEARKEFRKRSSQKGSQVCARMWYLIWCHQRLLFAQEAKIQDLSGNPKKQIDILLALCHLGILFCVIVYKTTLLIPFISNHLLSAQRTREHEIFCNASLSRRPKEFIECVSHIRLLSWLLLGSLTHNAVCPNASSSCLPIPLDAGSHIADHLIVILIGFPEQSKVSDFCKIKTICIKITNGNPYQPIMFLLRRKCIFSLALLWILEKQLCANALFKVV